MSLEIKKVIVDGEIRVQAFRDGRFLEEVDCNSQYSVIEAKKDLREKYL